MVNLITHGLAEAGLWLMTVLVSGAGLCSTSGGLDVSHPELTNVLTLTN